MDWLINYIREWRWEQIGWVAALALLGFLVSLTGVTALLVKLPATFFLDSHQRNFWIDRHPAVRWCGLVLKNLLGIVLIMTGIGLSIPGVPGQGLLTILIGIILLDFPGKRRLERKIVGRPQVLRFLNRLRARFHKPPILLHDEVD